MEVRAMKLSDVRKEIKACCDSVCQGTDIVISRKKGANVVIISEERYNALLAAFGNSDAAAPAAEETVSVETQKKEKSKKHPEKHKEINVVEPEVAPAAVSEEVPAAPAEISAETPTTEPSNA